MKTVSRCLLLCIAASISLTMCRSEKTGWKQEEVSIINNSGGEIMNLMKTNIKTDSLLLRTPSEPLSLQDMQDPLFETLIKGMLSTVQDTAMPGVGIAAPQVGILRRVILVQRFDLEGEPFIAYVNPEIIEYSDSVRIGGEGCLSIPDVYGKVSRAATIIVKYDTCDGKQGIDTVSGFTAAIFQHETDHLNGILFTDRMEEIIKR